MRHVQALAVLCVLIGINACGTPKLVLPSPERQEQKKGELRPKVADRLQLPSDASWKDIQRAAQEKYLKR